MSVTTHAKEDFHFIILFHSKLETWPFALNVERQFWKGATLVLYPARYHSTTMNEPCDVYSPVTSTACVICKTKEGSRRHLGSFRNLFEHPFIADEHWVPDTRGFPLIAQTSLLLAWNTFIHRTSHKINMFLCLPLQSNMYVLLNAPIFWFIWRHIAIYEEDDEQE